MSDKSDKSPVVEKTEIRPGRHVVKVKEVEFEVFVTPPPANLPVDEMRTSLGRIRTALGKHEDALRDKMREGKKVNDADVVPIVQNAITEIILINLMIPILILRGDAAGFERRVKPDKRLDKLVDKVRKEEWEKKFTKWATIFLLLIVLAIALGFMIANSG